MYLVVAQEDQKKVILANFRPEKNKKFATPQLRDYMLVISMANLVLIQLTLFNDSTRHFSQKAIFVRSLTYVTLLRKSQRRKRFLMGPGTRFDKIQEMVRIPSLQKIAII